MKKFYFFNRGLFRPQGTENVRIAIHPAEKDTANNPMFTEGFFQDPPLPWEVRYDNGYPNVIYDKINNTYKLYYTMIVRDKASEAADKATRAVTDYVPTYGRLTAIGYAESKDGIHWVKPNLGLTEFQGSTNNNILMLYAHGSGVLLDEAEWDPSKRYKMMTMVDRPGLPGFMAVCFSEDGIHWSDFVRWPKHNARGDAHNFVFRDKKDGKYKLITRIWRSGLRIAALSESDDFINWSEPKEALRGQGLESQVYSMPVFQEGDIYLGLASMFHEGDRTLPNFDTVDLELTYAIKPDTFDFVASGEPFIPRGKGHYPDGEFDCACIYCAAPVEIDGKLCFYYMGGNGRHTNFRETSFGRAFLEKDKYAYACQRDPSQPSLLMTSQIQFYGDTFDLKYDGNDVSVALVPDHHQPAFAGFDYGDCCLTKLNDGWTRVSFSKPLSDFSIGKRCNISIRFDNTKLFAIRGDFDITSANYGE